jgi:hypothetical protein
MLTVLNEAVNGVAMADNEKNFFKITDSPKTFFISSSLPSLCLSYLNTFNKFP